jgi:SNF2 family DNA or RNA helicase
MSKRRYNVQQKFWSIPADRLNELREKLARIDVTIQDCRGQGSAVQEMIVRIRNTDFKTNFGEIMTRPEMSRLWYLTRPRDGYRVAEILNHEGYKIKVIDNVKNVAIDMTPTVELYPFQEDCMKFLRKNDYIGLIALDMGLGKTIVACKAIEEIGKGPILIVAPSSLLYQWRDELIKHFGYDKAGVVTSKIKKEDRIDAMNEHDVTITNYEFIRALDTEYTRQYELVIMDEVHRVKNWTAKTSKAMANIPARRVIGLTGTPVVNDIKELYHITDQIKPAFFGTMTQFYKKYVKQERSGKMSYKNLEGIFNKLNNELMYRKKKDEVFMDLPKRIEQTIHVPLTQRERAGYEDMLKKQKHILAAISNAKVFAVSSALRLDDIKISSKEKELFSVLDDLVGRTIIFSGSKTEVKRLAKMLGRDDVFLLHGDINKEKREEVKAKFRESPNGILLMTEIGVEGLNLQYTGNLINFDLPWTHAMLEQRISRIERGGSDFDKIYVINMVSKDTIDNHVISVIARKAELFDVTVNGAPEPVAKAMAMDLFKLGMKVDKDGNIFKVKA